jgi:hypothetical protein
MLMVHSGESVNPGYQIGALNMLNPTQFRILSQLANANCSISSGYPCLKRYVYSSISRLLEVICILVQPKKVCEQEPRKLSSMH